MNSFHGSAHAQRSCQDQSCSTLKELLYKMEMPCSSYHIHIMLLSKMERSCFLLQNVWLRPFKHLCVFWRHIDRCWSILENIRYWQKKQSNFLPQDFEPGTEALAQLACPFLLEPWLPETLLYNLPICLLLICNTAFLIWIMGVSNFACLWQESTWGEWVSQSLFVFCSSTNTFPSDEPENLFFLRGGYLIRLYL